MVVEVKPRGVSKGAAIAGFMAETPFIGRRPLFAGDDVTDEDAFALVRSLGGMAIRVGRPGATLAHERIASVTEFREWLGALVRKLTVTHPTAV
jgi:trehalose 6-phosphate phosphatase